LSPPKIIDQGGRKELDDLRLEPWRHLTRLHTGLVHSSLVARHGQDTLASTIGA